MLEQEVASIMKFVLTKSNNPTPYYNEVPEGFLVPSAYFPVPEINSRGDTLATYALGYDWYIKFFHSEVSLVNQLAFNVFSGIKASRNLIHLIDEDGQELRKGIRIKDPSMKIIDNCTAQISLSWDSYRPYNKREYEKMVVYDLNMYSRQAYDNVLEEMKDRRFC